MADRIAAVPRKPVNTYRARESLKKGAQEVASERGENLSEHVIRPALRDYQDDPEKWAAEHAPDKEDV